MHSVYAPLKKGTVLSIAIRYCYPLLLMPFLRFLVLAKIMFNVVNLSLLNLLQD